MNTETGEIYRTAEAIEAARQRGEPLVEVSEKVARTMEAGQTVMNRRGRPNTRYSLKRRDDAR